MAAIGYFAAMAMLVPTLAVLTAAFSANATAGKTASPAVREASGSSAAVTVSARIVRASARIGAGFGPPMPNMVPRRTTVSAANGRPVAALVYDLE